MQTTCIPSFYFPVLPNYLSLVYLLLAQQLKNVHFLTHVPRKLAFFIKLPVFLLQKLGNYPRKIYFQVNSMRNCADGLPSKTGENYFKTKHFKAFGNGPKGNKLYSRKPETFGKKAKSLVFEPRLLPYPASSRRQRQLQLPAGGLSLRIRHKHLSFASSYLFLDKQGQSNSFFSQFIFVLALEVVVPQWERQAKRFLGVLPIPVISNQSGGVAQRKACHCFYPQLQCLGSDMLLGKKERQKQVRS